MALTACRRSVKETQVVRLQKEQVPDINNMLNLNGTSDSRI